VISANGDTSASEILHPLPLQAFQKKGKSLSQYPPQAQAKAERTQGYWNEYDDPESDEEGYYIYIDPNASVKFPGQELLEAWVRKTRKLLHMGKIKHDSQLTPSVEDVSSDDEICDETYDSSRESYGTMSPTSARTPQGGYLSSFFHSIRAGSENFRALDSIRRSELERQNLLAEVQVRQHEREIAKLQLYTSCLGAAAILDIVLGILTNTSRRRLRGEVDRVVILGVIGNLLLLLAAVAAMMSRREKLGFIHQGIVFSIVLAMVAADVLLFRWALL
jgi:hypothetical protein